MQPIERFEDVKYIVNVYGLERIGDLFNVIKNRSKLFEESVVQEILR